MVFLIQNTQNRDTGASQLKLDELIRANQSARNRMLCIEDLTEDELKKVKATSASLGDTGRAGHRGALKCGRNFLRRTTSIEYDRHPAQGRNRRATGHRA